MLKLEASVLQEYCYQYMFRDCKKLNKIICLASTLDPFALEGWVDGVASAGTFTRKNGVTWPIGINGIPSGWSIVDQ